MTEIQIIDPCGACNTRGRFDATGRPTPYGIRDCESCHGTGSLSFRCAYSSHRKPWSELAKGYKVWVCKSCAKDISGWGTN